MMLFASTLSKHWKDKREYFSSEVTLQIVKADKEDSLTWLALISFQLLFLSKSPQNT